MDVSEFGQMAGEFDARVRRIAWCTVATVAPSGAPWTRILHPIWEGETNPVFGLLRLDPTRIELTGLASSPKPKVVWHRSAD
jgi:hypothetical protein